MMQNNGHVIDCGAAYGDGPCDEPAKCPASRPYRTFAVGDRVKVNRGTFDGALGEVSHVFIADDGHVSVSVAFPNGVTYLPRLAFSPSELDLAYVGDRMADDFGLDWRLPR